MVHGQAPRGRRRHLRGRDGAAGGREPQRAGAEERAREGQGPHLGRRQKGAAAQRERLPGTTSLERFLNFSIYQQMIENKPP